MTIFDSIKYPVPDLGDKTDNKWVLNIPKHFIRMYATHPESRFMELEQRRNLLRRIILEYDSDNI